jgi:hypothetical protein
MDLRGSIANMVTAATIIRPASTNEIHLVAIGGSDLATAWRFGNFVDAGAKVPMRSDFPAPEAFLYDHIVAAEAKAAHAYQIAPDP